VAAAVGLRPALPRWLADLFDREERVTEMPNDLQLMKSLVRERIAL
jgi:threonine synthase